MQRPFSLTALKHSEVYVAIATGLQGHVYQDLIAGMFVASVADSFDLSDVDELGDCSREWAYVGIGERGSEPKDVQVVLGFHGVCIRVDWLAGIPLCGRAVAGQPHYPLRFQPNLGIVPQVPQSVVPFGAVIEDGIEGAVHVEFRVPEEPA